MVQARGSAISGVVNETTDPATGETVKTIGGVNYQKIALIVDVNMTSGFYDWIRAVLRGDDGPQTGSIVALDFDHNSMWELDFTDALFTGVTIPGGDGSSQEPARMTVTFQPTSLKRTVLGPGIINPPDVASQKQWLASNFRVEIGDLSSTTVFNIEPIIIIRRAVFEENDPRTNELVLVPGPLEISNLVITFSEVDAQEFYDWHRAFIIEGRTGETLDCALEYLSPDLEDVLFRLELFDLGILSLQGVDTEAGALAVVDPHGKVGAEMFITRIELTTAPGP